MGEFSSTWLTVIYLLISVSFVFLGNMGQSAIGRANQCTMTYSRPQQFLIPVETNVPQYNLYEHINGNQKSNRAASNVLFLPGNSGSSLQVRSIASLNDGTFKFYAADFGISMSATHGSIVLTQAVFVNDALRTIVAASSKDTQEVIILAHSVGGMVARTAMILSNHPKCVVTAVIMFGSPNSRPAYTPDASLSTLYAGVNNAWRKSFYTTSPGCVAVAGWHADDPHTRTYYDANETIRALWNTCAPCVARTKLISIAGGEGDMQVHSALSHLNSIAPQPHNMSAEVPYPVKIGMLLKPKGGYVRYVINSLLSLVSPSKSDDVNETKPSPAVLGDEVAVNESPVSTTAPHGGSEAPVEVRVDAEFNFDVSVAESSPSDPALDSVLVGSDEYPPLPRNNSARKSHPYSSVTMDNWVLHMAPYVDPPHISVRTSQLPGVGFLVDHKALLWCNEVMRSVNTYMHRIVEAGSDTTVSLSSIVEVKSEFQPTLISDDIIAPLVTYLGRNASFNMYSVQAVDAERNVMYGFLSNSTLWLMATVYHTSFATTILTCYMMVPLLVISSAILFEIGDKSVWALSKKPKSDFDALMPANHLFLGILDDVFMILCPKIYLFVCSKANVIWPVVIAVLVLRLAVDMGHPVLFLRRYGFYFQWCVSYGVALTLHMIVLAIITTARKMFSFFGRSGYMALRWTVWCNFIRRKVRASIKPRRKQIEFVINVVNLEALVLISVVVATAVVGTYVRQKNGGSVGVIMVYTSVCYLGLMTYFLVLFSAALLWKPKDSSSLLSSILALYMPAIVLLTPSASYCLTIILGDQSMLATMSSVLEIFGPELINYTLCMTCIVCHLAYALRNRTSFKPVAFISEIFDLSRSAHREHLHCGSLSSVFIPSADTATSKSSCVHEDGGELAIFEENTVGVQIQGNGKVLVGAAYKVVSCNCSLNKSLQFYSEWCEWCRCKKCGGKVLPRMSDSPSRTLVMPDISSDLAVFAAVVVIAVMGSLYAHDYPYKNIYIMGFVGAAFIGFRIGRYYGY